MDIGTFKEQLKKLPSKPGIYLFKNSRKALYIGKALNLKNRVSHYLKTEDIRLKKMLSEANGLDFIQTDSDIEALILESQYIKKYQPAFNIMLRDDKQYFYVGFTHSTSSGQAENFPKIFLTHQPHSDNFKFKILNSKLNSASAEFIGPFTDGSAIKTTLRLLRKIFPYCTCRQSHNNYCLNYHIGKCMGGCCLKNNEHKNNEQRTYLKNIKAIKDILSGKKSKLIKNFEQEMKIMSDKQEFEKAKELQYKIEKLKRVFQNATIIENLKFKIENSDEGNQPGNTIKQLGKILGVIKPLHRIEAYDIANIQGKHAVGAMVVFINGKPDRNEYRKFKIRMFGGKTSKHSSGGDTGMLGEVLTRRFNHPEWSRPDLILVDGGRGQLNAARSIIKDIPIIALTKNEKHMGHKITLEGKEILLSKLTLPVKNILLQIDSEAHGFAISYYRTVHRKSI